MKYNLVVDKKKAIVDSFDAIKRIKQKYPEEYVQLDPTKIALTLFIQNRREKSSKE